MSVKAGGKKKGGGGCRKDKTGGRKFKKYHGSYKSRRFERA
jgi:hypothetical protein